MGEIKYLLKFGQLKHMEAFAAGNLYCSNAQTFWGIEDELKIKGQGDRLEACSRFFGHEMTIYNYDDLSLVSKVPNGSALVRFGPAEKLPVFCLFAVYEDDCVSGSDDVISIKLSEEIKKTIREHFPKADAVAIIDNPDLFLNDVENSIGREIKHSAVQYFHIDKGVPTADGQQAIDRQYLKYLTQDEPPIIEDGMRVSRFLERHVYRSLLCKDVFFRNEQEYRIILLNDSISKGTSYPVRYSHKIHVMDQNSFFDGM